MRWILVTVLYLLAFNLVILVLLHHFLGLSSSESKNNLFWNNGHHQLPNIKFETIRKADKNNHHHVHIVFSTDCSGYQHWQSIAFWYSARIVGHQGNVTRIASGCSSAEREQIEKEWKLLNISPNSQQKFRVHFTPSFSYNNSQQSSAAASQKKNYKYSNKPGGLLHFLQYNNNFLRPNDVLCLLDPDMLLLKPITSTIIKKGWTKHFVGKRNNQVEYWDEHGTPQALRVAWLEKEERDSNPSEFVTHGHPAGQHFGVGGAWARAMTKKEGAWQNFNKSKVCGSSSSSSLCTVTSFEDADSQYAVGPVYLATVNDWHRIAETWWDFFPRVYEQYPYLLAEMYAFCMAIANLQLSFTVLSNYMISSPTTQSPTEGWTWVLEQLKEKEEEDVCEYSLRQLRYTPTVLHYCQNYKFANHLFAKRKISHSFFQCSQPTPLPLNRSHIAQYLRDKEVGSNTDVTRKTAFALCYSISILNQAQLQYQKEVCAQLTN